MTRSLGLPLDPALHVDGAVVAVALVLGACHAGPTAQASAETTPTESTSNGEAGTSSSATSAPTTRADTNEPSDTTVSASGSDETTTGLPDSCPPADPDFAVGSGLVLSLESDWPFGPTIDANCNVVDVRLEPIGLLLECVHPESQGVVELAMRTGGAAEAQLAPLVGTMGARLSFYMPEFLGFGCDACLDVSLRDNAGELMVLTRGYSDYDFVRAEGETIELSSPGWLDPRSDAFLTWSDPFDSITARHVGCIERESLRPGSRVETPLEVAFAVGNDVLALYDRNGEQGALFGERTFDIIVSRAFFRGPLNCGDCPATEIAFLVVRSVD